jgi:nucleoside-diphosphate-sugar epimerase
MGHHHSRASSRTDLSGAGRTFSHQRRFLDREGTTKAFSALDKVTDLVFAAYIEKPTMAETVEPNARMLKNTLDALAARNVPLQRIVLAGGAKSYGFSLGAFNAPANALVPASLARKKEADMLGTALAGKSAVASARGEA